MGGCAHRWAASVVRYCWRAASVSISVPGGAFCVHGKPHRPNHNPHDAGGDILRDLRVVFVGKLLSLDVVCLYLRLDHRAVALRILRLNHCDRMRITASTRRQDEADARCRKHSRNATAIALVTCLALAGCFAGTPRASLGVLYFAESLSAWAAQKKTPLLPSGASQICHKASEGDQR